MYLVNGHRNTGLSQPNVQKYAEGYQITKGLASDANYASYLGTDRIRDYIEITRSLGLTTALIGHSYGGDAVFDGALYAASRNLRIDYLATIDPVDGSGILSRHSVAEAQTVKGVTGRWIDVRSTTSDDKWFWQKDMNDNIKTRGGPMRNDVQAVAAPFYFQTGAWDHAGFQPMFDRYAKSYLDRLYR